MKSESVIVVHGGAGAWKLKDERLVAARTACGEAAASGQAVLSAGGGALDAVEAAVRLLEDCPVLDAGRGSYPNRDGNVEMDALIMDGRDLSLGVVAAVQRVAHPISLARRILDEPDFNLLAGSGASTYADAIGFPRCDLADLLVAADSVPSTDDTVGAVALDTKGNLACATSTGGTKAKHPGRIGDSPQVGSGGYADNRSAAVSATGRGEELMKLMVSKLVCDFVLAGLEAQQASTLTIAKLGQRLQATGGLITIDQRGRVGIAYNTTAMPYAYAKGMGSIEIGS